MAKTDYPTQSTSHIGRIRHRRNGAKPAKWATNAATKSPTAANTVEPASRPAECEANAVRKIVRLVARTGCRTHILHVSSGLSVDVLRRAKAEGLPVSAETCPHYLTLDCDHIPDNATAVKCCPPIRDLHEQDALWAGLADGTLDCVATGHSPADAGMKAGTFATAWGGVSSLQVGFRTVLTGALKRGFASSDVVRWMSRNTARLAGLDDRGEIAPGLRADLAIVRP